MTPGAREGRAGLPGVDMILRSEGASRLIAAYGRPPVVEAVRTALAERRRYGAGASVVSIVEECAVSLWHSIRPSQRRVFNLTGTVLHTNLGRAPLPEEAVA